MRDLVLALRCDQLILLHEVFHDLNVRGVQLVHLSQFFFLLAQLIHQFLVPADETQPFLKQRSLSVVREVMLKGMPGIDLPLTVDIMLYVILILGDLPLQMLKIHLHLLLQLDMTSNIRLQLLGQSLEGFVAVDTDEVLAKQLDEVLHKVIGKHGLGTCYGWILVESCQFREIVLSWEHAFQCIQDEILGMLEEVIMIGARGFQQALELFQHGWITMIIIIGESIQNRMDRDWSLQVHIPSAAAATSGASAAGPSATLKLFFFEGVEEGHRAVFCYSSG